MAGNGRKMIQKCGAGEELQMLLCAPVQVAAGAFGNATVVVAHLPNAAELKYIKVYNVTRAGGSPVIKVGTAADDDAYVASVAMPANNTVLTCTLVSTAVAADSEIIAVISGGDTTDPAGVLVQVGYVEK